MVSKREINKQQGEKKKLNKYRNSSEAKNEALNIQLSLATIEEKQTKRFNEACEGRVCVLLFFQQSF